MGDLSRLQATEMVKNASTSTNINNDCKVTNDANEIEPIANESVVDKSETHFQPKLAEHDKDLTIKKSSYELPLVFQSRKFNPPSSILNFDKNIEITKENPEKIKNDLSQNKIESNERKNEIEFEHECVDDHEDAYRDLIR